MTSLAGTGTILLAILNTLGLVSVLFDAVFPVAVKVGVDVTTLGWLNDVPAFTTNAGMSGIVCNGKGRGRVGAEVVCVEGGAPN